MATVNVYNLEGKKVSDYTLNDAIFSVAANPLVIQQVVVAQQANARPIVASVKDRSEVSGGGRKPWRQKGTGRARHGSSRSPIWKGGGVTFGPTADRNFSKKVNKKVRRKALLMTLSDKVANEKLMVFDALTLPEVKTKTIFKALQGISVKPKKASEKAPSVLLVLDNENINAALSARNIEKVSIAHVDSLRVVDIMKHQYLVAPLAVIKKIEQLFA